LIVMRTFHCTVALVTFVLVAGPGHAQPSPEGHPANFTVFVQGVAVGAEQVTVVRTPQGITITGDERIGPPISLVARRAEIRYTADWRPLECLVEGSVRNEAIVVHARVTGTTVTTEYMQGTTPGRKTDQIAADALLLPNIFFGAYEALAARLADAKAGDRLSVYIPPVSAATVSVISVSDDRVRTEAELVRVRRYALEVAGSSQPTGVELWADPAGRLLRFSVPARGFDIIRSDIAAITSRREPVARPNDERISIPSNGFSLTGTLSQPATKPAPGVRLPAVVLVSGSAPTDREEMLAGIPIFGQLASALADAGFVVVRYDKRGVGQSGGRTENTTLADYAEDAIAAVKFLEHRSDIDRHRVAVLGYGEGGAIAASAASREGSIAALVLVNAPGATGATYVLEQQEHLLSLMKIPDADRRAKIALQEKVHQAVLTGKGLEELPTDLRREADTPWFRSFLAFDPAKVLSKCHQPILIVQGEMDREVAPVNADRLETIARARQSRAGQAVKVVKLPTLNHLLVPAPTGELDEYDHLADKTIGPGVATAIDAWLKDTMGAR
jgi:pimeloyl-ACP methyl ester carboxylesterase